MEPAWTPVPETPAATMMRQPGGAVTVAQRVSVGAESADKGGFLSLRYNLLEGLVSGKVRSQHPHCHISYRFLKARLL